VRYLILSDIHANWEALSAVLEEAAKDGYDKMACLGDLAGYGADPNAVIDWVRAQAIPTIRGNHDRAAIGQVDLEWFNPAAQQSTVWTMNVLSAESRDYLAKLPAGPLDVNGFSMVHGSPLDEDEYVVTATEAANVAQYTTSQVTWFGHTHLQGGFQVIRRAVVAINKVPKDADRFEVRLFDDVKYLLNPGSVGQPRDQDWRAAWALYESGENRVIFRRCAYDIRAAQEKILAAGLPEILAARLDLGR
jgi:predicted phosphodiesterase